MSELKMKVWLPQNAVLSQNQGLTVLNPLPPRVAVRKQKILFPRIFSVQYCQNLKKYHPSKNVEFNNLGFSEA